MLAYQMKRKIEAMPEMHTTVQVAKKLRVHVITLYHWLKAGLIKPSQSFSVDKERKHWLWTDADIEAARKLKAGRRPGPKPKPKKGK